MICFAGCGGSIHSVVFSGFVFRGSILTEGDVSFRVREKFQGLSEISRCRGIGPNLMTVDPGMVREPLPLVLLLRGGEARAYVLDIRHIPTEDDDL